MGYVYRETERGVWTVGFYRQSNVTHQPKFEAESDWSTPEAAASRVNFMNGGSDTRWKEEL